MSAILSSGLLVAAAGMSCMSACSVAPADAAVAPAVYRLRYASPRFGHKRGLQWLAMAPEQQRRFDASYNQGARQSARELSRYGVLGMPIFERAQALIATARESQHD